MQSFEQLAQSPFPVDKATTFWRQGKCIGNCLQPDGHLAFVRLTVDGGNSIDIKSS